MAFLDLFLGLLLLYGILKGIWNGFLAEFASVIALFAGLYIAIRFAQYFQNYLSLHTNWSNGLILFASYALPLLLTIIGILMLSKICSSLLSFAGLGIFNKIGGGVFGLLKMALILGVALNFFANLNIGYQLASKENLEKSLFYEPILKTGSWIYPQLKDWIGKSLS